MKKKTKILTILGATTPILFLPMALSAKCKNGPNDPIDITKPNLESLKKAIKDVNDKKLLENLEITTETDPANVQKGKRFTSQAAVDAFKLALGEAKKVNDESKAALAKTTLLAEVAKFEAAIKVGTKEGVVNTPNLDSLKAAINEVENKKLLENLEITTETDPAKVEKGKRFTSQAAVDAYNAVLTAAKAVTSESEAEAAKTTFLAGINAFETAIKVGTKSLTPKLDALKDKIAQIKAELKFDEILITAETEVNKVKKGVRFTLQADADTYKAALAAAEVINAEDSAEAAQTTFVAAYEEFKSKIKVGTNDIEEVAATFKISYPNADKTDADEVDLSKIKFLTSTDQDITTLGYLVKDLEFVNSIATNEEIDNGLRIFKVAFEKEGVKTEILTKNVAVHKSHHIVIKKQLEEIKKGELKVLLNDTVEARAWIESHEDSILYYDFKENSFYTSDNADKIAIFKFNKKLAYKSKQYSTGIYKDDNKEPNRIKIVKKSDGKYGIKFILGVYHTDPTTRIYHYETTEMYAEAFTALNKAILDAEVDRIKTLITYQNISNVELGEATKDGVSFPVLNIPNVESKITKFEIDEANKKIIVTYQLISGILSSKEEKVEFTGFKLDELLEKFEGVTIEYEEANNTLPSQFNESKVKFKKAGSDYTFADVDSIRKEVVAGTANDNTGTLTIKVTITKNGKSRSKEFAMSGFKFISFDFDNFIANVAIDYTGDKANTLPTKVETSSISVTGSGISEVTYKVELSKINNKAGSIHVKVTFTNKAGDQNRVKEIDLNGFKNDEESIKKLLKPELYDVFVNNDIFVVKDKNKLIDDLKLSTFNKLKIEKDGKIISVRNGKKWIPITSLELISEAKFHTHGGKDAVPVRPSDWDGKDNTKGLTITKIKDNVYQLSWKLAFDKTTVYDQVFTQIIDLN